jgi:hypothetical protein
MNSRARTLIEIYDDFVRYGRIFETKKAVLDLVKCCSTAQKKQVWRQLLTRMEKNTEFRAFVIEFLAYEGDKQLGIFRKFRGVFNNEDTKII